MAVVVINDFQTETIVLNCCQGIYPITLELKYLLNLYMPQKRVS
jgi:hypothetical protein